MGTDVKVTISHFRFKLNRFNNACIIVEPIEYYKNAFGINLPWRKTNNIKGDVVELREINMWPLFIVTYWLTSEISNHNALTKGMSLLFIVTK